MPGFTVILGFMLLSSPRHLLEKKPRTVTVDAHIITNVRGGCAESMQALLYYFLPAGTVDPREGVLHYIHGRCGPQRFQRIDTKHCLFYLLTRV